MDWKVTLFDWEGTWEVIKPFVEMVAPALVVGVIMWIISIWIPKRFKEWWGIISIVTIAGLLIYPFIR